MVSSMEHLVALWGSKVMTNLCVRAPGEMFGVCFIVLAIFLNCSSIDSFLQIATT